MAENKIKSALEAGILQKLVVEAKAKNPEGRCGQTSDSKSWRLDCIYDNKPLEFEKDPLNSVQEMQA